MQSLPLFPLPTLVYPGGILPLQIFEPRYLSMVKACLKNESGFVVVQTTDEADTADNFFDVGCYCEITDWHPLPNDLLGIDVSGTQRVRIHRSERQSDGLIIGECEWLPAEQSVVLTDQHQTLLKLLKDIQRHPMVEMLGLDIDYDDATAVGYRLAEFLPFTPQEKQLLLESESPLARLDAIQTLIRQLSGG